MFWVRYGYNKDLGSKKQQVSRPSLENRAPKASWFQHVKFSSSDCPIVPRFGFCSYFWKWKPPRENNFLNLIIFLPSNASKCVKFTKTVNFGRRDPKFWLSVYFWKSKPPWQKNQNNLSTIYLSNIDNTSQIFKIVNFEHRDPRFGLSVY